MLAEVPVVTDLGRALAGFLASLRKTSRPRSGPSPQTAHFHGFSVRAGVPHPARALPLHAACKSHKGGNVPSPLFNFLFLAALIVPAVMYITGVIILMLSLVVKHYRLTHASAHPREALAQ